MLNMRAGRSVAEISARGVAFCIIVLENYSRFVYKNQINCRVCGIVARIYIRNAKIYTLAIYVGVGYLTFNIYN